MGNHSLFARVPTEHVGQLCIRDGVGTATAASPTDLPRGVGKKDTSGMMRAVVDGGPRLTDRSLHIKAWKKLGRICSAGERV